MKNPVSILKNRGASILAVSQSKGGIGKSSLSMNLGGGLAKEGYRVLICDLDPQSNLSKSFVLTGNGTVREVFEGGKPEPRATAYDGLKILPADKNLSGVLPSLMADFGEQFLLKEYLAEVASDYDFVILDTPPSVNGFSTAGLLAATHVLIPISTQFFSIQGTRDLIENIQKVSKRFNPGLSILGAVVTIFEQRSALSQEVMSKAMEYFGNRLFSTVISRSVRIEEAQVRKSPLVYCLPSSDSSKEYQALTREVVERLEVKYRNSNEKSTSLVGV